MNRFQFALDVATAPGQISLPDLAHGFHNAVEHTTAEGSDPFRDPAVLLLGSFIAFQVHADVNSAHGYQTLLQSCFNKAENARPPQ